MRITKTIECSVDLYNSAEIYVTDKRALVLKKLKEKYEGRCYSECYIETIEEIINISAICLSQKLDGSAKVDVCFRATCIIYTGGEVLAGCRINSSTNSSIIATTKIAVIKIERNQIPSIYDVISVGMDIPVVVNNVRYAIGARKIAISARPFVPVNFLPNYVIYKIGENDISFEEVEKFKLLMKKIYAESTSISKDVSESVNLFAEMIYPFKSELKLGDEEIYGYRANNIKIIDLFSETDDGKFLFEIKNCLVIAPRQKLSSNKFLIYLISLDSNKKIQEYSDNSKILEEFTAINKEDIQLRETTVYASISDICNEIYMQTIALKELSEFYSDKKIISSIQAYWRICISTKK